MGAALELRPEQSVRARSRAASSQLVAGARRIVRSWFSTIPGPYTSAVLYTDPAGGWQMQVSQRAALAIDAVYRALAIYADLIGTMPVQRLRGDERLPLPAFVQSPAGIPVGWTDEVGQALWSLLLRGDTYARPTTWDSTGYPATFSVLDPDAVAVEQRRGVGLVYAWDTDAGRVELANPDPTELLHIRWQRPPGSPCGLGIVDSQSSTLAGAAATDRYQLDTMLSPTPPAVLTHPLRLKKAQAEALQDQWADSIGRSRAVPAVLSGGITYQPLTLTPRDVQLIDSQRWNATKVATVFGLPPYLVGGSTGDSLTYSTVEGELTRLWTMALMPAATRLERAFGAWTPYGQRLRFVPDSLLRSQTLDRYNAHKIALDAGFETVDEVRALENLPPLETPAPAPSSSSPGPPGPPATGGNP